MICFDENNVILRFGVASDTHVSGSWNQPRSKAKFAHMLEVFKRTAGVDEEGKTRLDAVLVNGDFVDAVNSPANVFKNYEVYGNKLAQNVREIGHVSDCLLGEQKGGVGEGIADNAYFFYALGNHDEGGCGRTGYDPQRQGFPSMHSAAIFAAIFCGWKCNDFDESNTEFEDYINDLMLLHESKSDKDMQSFGAKYRVDAGMALSLYEKYYGRDISPKNEDALLFGNRATVLGGCYFVALEISCCEKTCSFLERICEKSVAEDPRKPIFVLTHYRVKDTIFLSGDGTSKLNCVLEKYPQIVIWGGHTHTPLFIERAIDTTNGYTSVDSSVTAYLSTTGLMSIGGEAVFPHNLPFKEVHSFGNGCYVEVDKQYNVRISRVDLYRSFSTLYAEKTVYSGIGEFADFEQKSETKPCDSPVFIREPWIISSNVCDRHYTKKRASIAPPAFPENAALELVKGENGVEVTFPCASSDDMVFKYIVSFENKKTGDKQSFILTTYSYKYTCTEQMPKTMQDTFNEITEKGLYIVSVVAYDVWDNQSQMLSAELEI